MQLLVLGDIALASTPQVPWSPPGGLVPGAESRVLFNWELPLGDSLNPTPRLSGPRLVSDPGSLAVLQRWAPGFAALATNHILDAGAAGFGSNLSVLRQAGFLTVGAGMTAEEIARPLTWETQAGRLAVLNWVFPETHPECDAVPGPNCWPGLPQAVTAIQALKQQVDWVLVLAHWSDELFAFPPPAERRVARALAEAGADIIIGHHPHVVRGCEQVGACPVFYSLGNYYFSNFHNTRGAWLVQTAPLNRQGLGVLLDLDRERGLSYRLLSFVQEGAETRLDPRRRAALQVEWTSASFSLNLDQYETWYRIKRRRFDRFWGRWHFGVRRLGLRGLLAKALHIFR